MNKLLLICGMIMLGTVSTPQEEEPLQNCEIQTESVESTVEEVPVMLASNQVEVWEAPKLISLSKEVKEDLDLNSIVYIEEETDFDLGFDTGDYLPEGFDPCEVYVDLKSISFIEEEENPFADLHTEKFLPEDFNAYAAPEDFMSVSYMEEEEALELGFDTAEYLPAGFDPYEVYFDLNSIEYIEETDEVELDFDPMEYLPEGFDPYSR